MLYKHPFNGFKIVCDLDNDDVAIFTVSCHLLETFYVLSMTLRYLQTLILIHRRTLK